MTVSITVLVMEATGGLQVSRCYSKGVLVKFERGFHMSSAITPLELAAGYRDHTLACYGSTAAVLQTFLLERRPCSTLATHGETALAEEQALRRAFRLRRTQVAMDFTATQPCWTAPQVRQTYGFVRPMVPALQSDNVHLKQSRHRTCRCRVC